MELLAEAEGLDSAGRTDEESLGCELLEDGIRLTSVGIVGKVALTCAPSSCPLGALPFSVDSFPGMRAASQSHLEHGYLSWGALARAFGTRDTGGSEQWPSSTSQTLYSSAFTGARTTLVQRPRVRGDDWWGSFILGQGAEADVEDAWTVEEASVIAEEEGRENYSVTTLETPSDTKSTYTRGKTGSMKPFMPGGVGKEGHNVAATSALDDDRLSQSAIDASLVVVGSGSVEPSHLLSVPPVVTFSQGLAPSHVEESEASFQGVPPPARERGEGAIPPPTSPPAAAAETVAATVTAASAATAATAATAAPVAPLPPPPADYDNDDRTESDGQGVKDVKDLLSHRVEAQPRMEGRAAIVKHILNMHKDPPQSRASWAVTDTLDVSDFASLVPNPAIAYPFELDGFQKQAVARLERKECVFVAAHTSAGKTVVAEYAIAMAAQHMTRAIYTSPIKALSNQKYRDFKTRFGDVGLITGDVSINPEASCLIMTTEILRSMLYRGADLVRDIEWVIFDEVHYINDSERGVVWEEVIIMLPDHANMIFLSATTPNTIEFSDWIGRTKMKPVHVITTNYRPVPLQHHLWAGNELIKVMDQSKRFLASGHGAAVANVAPKSADNKQGGKSSSSSSSGGGSGGGKNNSNSRPANRREVAGSRGQWTGLVGYLKKKTLMPAVVFSFSKRKCEECADALASTDLSTGAEKAQIHQFCSFAVKRLQERDAKLPQVLRLREMLKRGVGVHHGGLLPILKEVVEILFSRGLVKVLFATETFAMGVNMPARTVVFNGVRKHDGKDFRDLLPGEYTQMAGRAGRRGLDKVGTVMITCWNDVIPLAPLKMMLTGTATKLESQFRLKYNMILNLLRVEDMSVEDMIKRSFSEFATQRALGARDLPKQLEDATTQLATLSEDSSAESCIKADVAQIEDYMAASVALEGLSQAVYSFVLNTKHSNQVLGRGRILTVTHGPVVNAPAVVLRGPVAEEGAHAGPMRTATLLCMLLCPAGHVLQQPQKEVDEATAAAARFGGRTCVLKDGMSGTAQHDRAYLICEVPVRGITGLGKERKRFDEESVLRAEAGAMASLVSVLEQVEASLIGGSFTQLDLVKDQKMNNLDFADLSRDLLHTRKTREGMLCHDCPKLTEQYTAQGKRQTLSNQIERMKHVLSNESLTLFPDFQQRLAVLRSLGYVDRGGSTVELKGRVACEINTCDELIATEMVFENVLAPLDPPEVAGILSALIFQDKSASDPPVLSMRLHVAKDSIIDIARGLGELAKRHGLPVDPEEMVKANLNFGLVDCVYEWARGVSFGDIAQLTTVQEGTIVRTITRLDEVCRELRIAARVLGDPVLYRKMEATSALIKRDVIFVSSIYVA